MRSATKLGRLELATSTRGMTVQVYGANGAKAPTSDYRTRLDAVERFARAQEEGHAPQAAHRRQGVQLPARYGPAQGTRRLAGHRHGAGPTWPSAKSRSTRPPPRNAQVWRASASTLLRRSGGRLRPPCAAGGLAAGFRWGRAWAATRRPVVSPRGRGRAALGRGPCARLTPRRGRPRIPSVSRRGSRRSSNERVGLQQAGVKGAPRRASPRRRRGAPGRAGGRSPGRASGNVRSLGAVGARRARRTSPAASGRARPGVLADRCRAARCRSGAAARRGIRAGAARHELHDGLPERQRDEDRRERQCAREQSVVEHRHLDHHPPQPLAVPPARSPGPCWPPARSRSRPPARFPGDPSARPPAGRRTTSRSATCRAVGRTRRGRAGPRAITRLPFAARSWASGRSIVWESSRPTSEDQRPRRRRRRVRGAPATARRG